jgi:hypothetical protein
MRRAGRSLVPPLVGAIAFGVCCRGGSAETEAAKPAAPVSTGAANPSATELRIFDEIVRVDRVFTDAGQRALYEEQPVQALDNRRIYTFVLKFRPGMQKDRHFHIVTVAVSAAGSGRQPGTEQPTMGPNGSFTDKVVRTADDRYELRLSEGMLLPDAVDVPDLDLGAMGQTIALRYAATLGRR